MNVMVHGHRFCRALNCPAFTPYQCLAEKLNCPARTASRSSPPRMNVTKESNMPRARTLTRCSGTMPNIWHARVCFNTATFDVHALRRHCRGPQPANAAERTVTPSAMGPVDSVGWLDDRIEDSSSGPSPLSRVGQRSLRQRFRGISPLIADPEKHSLPSPVHARLALPTKRSFAPFRSRRQHVATQRIRSGARPCPRSRRRQSVKGRQNRPSRP
ncbi:hypothetical protein C8Q79DRAFT_969772 [Trametes meyenii]|nr:hypothetical protein C8Q79DRAFT_969772 [Trametes meyenii]